MCGFKSRSWHLCPWARHLTIIASLHPGVNGYLWGQRWFLWLISLWLHYIFGGTGCILPRELRWFKEWFKAQWSGVIMLEAIWDMLYRRSDLWRHSKTITWFARVPPGKTFVFWQPARKCMQSHHDYASFCPAKHDVYSVFFNRGRFECKHRSHRLYCTLSFNQTSWFFSPQTCV